MGFCVNCGKQLNVGEECNCSGPKIIANTEYYARTDPSDSNNKTFQPKKKIIKARQFYLFSLICFVTGIIGCICFYNNDYTFRSEVVREVEAAFEGEAHVKMMETLWLILCYVSWILILASVLMLIVGLIKSRKYKKVGE